MAEPVKDVEEEEEEADEGADEEGDDAAGPDEYAHWPLPGLRASH